MCILCMGTASIDAHSADDPQVAPIASERPLHAQENRLRRQLKVSRSLKVPRTASYVLACVMTARHAETTWHPRIDRGKCAGAVLDVEPPGGGRDAGPHESAAAGRAGGRHQGGPSLRGGQQLAAMLAASCICTDHAWHCVACDDSNTLLIRSRCGPLCVCIEPRCSRQVLYSYSTPCSSARMVLARPAAR